MTISQKELVRYRIECVWESLRTARLVADGGFGRAASNRLYYALVYVATALLLSRGLSSSKHAGIRSFLHKEFVKKGILTQETGRLYDALFEQRTKGDYEDMIQIDVASVEPHFPGVERFIREVETIISNTPIE